MIWHALTAVLIVLKLTELITVSWWIVFLPSIGAFTVTVLLAVAGVLLVLKANK